METGAPEEVDTAGATEGEAEPLISVDATAGSTAAVTSAAGWPGLLVESAWAPPTPAVIDSPSRTGTHLPSGPSDSIAAGTVFGKEKKSFAESFGIDVGRDRDRPRQVAPLRVELVEQGDILGVGDDCRLAQISQLVEDAKRVDPASQNVGTGRQSDPVGVQLPDPLLPDWVSSTGRPRPVHPEIARSLPCLQPVSRCSDAASVRRDRAIAALRRNRLEMAHATEKQAAGSTRPTPRSVLGPPPPRPSPPDGLSLQATL